MKAHAVKFILASAVAFLLAPIAYGAGTWEDRPTGVRDKDGASEWWMSTWRTGDRITTTTQYGVTGTMRIFTKDKDKVKWYDLKSRFLEQDHRVDLQGVSRCATTVLLGNGPNGEPLPRDYSVQLLRTYECPMSTRGAAVIGIEGGLEAEARVRKTYTSFYEIMRSPEMQKMWRQRLDSARSWAKTAVVAKLATLSLVPSFQWVAFFVPVAPKAIDVAWECGEEFASKKLAESYKNSVERLSSATFKEGGIEAKKGSPLYMSFSSKEVQEAINFATQFNSLFAGKDYYLATKAGDVTFAKEIVRSNSVWKCIMEAKDFLDLPERMLDLPVTPDEGKVADVFTRETLNVNAKLFDARKRRVSEVWPVDASLLNNFLHPDLKGAFTGKVFMKYVEDKEITVGNENYAVRRLKMENKYRGEGSVVRYSEPGDFNMEYNPGKKDADAQIEICVDKSSGYIVKAHVEMDGTAELLPDLMLVRGWGFKNGEGKLKFTMDAENIPTRILTKPNGVE